MVDVRHYTEPPFIDYRKFAAALDHYESRGYQYREVPWVVDHASMAVTLPPELPATRVQYGDLVGSGEQSFIELMRRGEQVLKACCITPCFRIEENYDELHHPYFMKCELINTDATHENLQQMIDDARQFFDTYTETEIETTGPNMYDIVDTRLHTELGSYGFRLYNDMKFIYGTGLALPRLDSVLKKQSTT